MFSNRWHCRHFVISTLWHGRCRCTQAVEQEAFGGFNTTADNEPADYGVATTQEGDDSGSDSWSDNGDDDVLQVCTAFLTSPLVLVGLANCTAVA